MSDRPARPRVLAVAGLDPTGGAGLLADVEAVRAAGGLPLVACAALTAQGPAGVTGILPVSEEFLRLQIETLGPVDACKTGMLGAADAAALVADLVGAGVLPRPVVDPVSRSSSGHPLLDDGGAAVLRARLLPAARAVTPNLAEAGALTGMAVDTPAAMEDAARALVDLGVGMAVVTGGHLPGDLVDVGMCAGDSAPWRVARPRVPGTARGTGCRFASALATYLARGDAPREAVAAAGALVARHVVAWPRSGGAG